MIPVKDAHLQVAARTHPGLQGKNNEDRYAISAYQVSSSDPRPSLLAVISDGIGGHRAGEIAAEIAVEEISHAVATSDALHPVETLSAAIITASEKIHEQAQLNRDQDGMGATCVCAWVIGDRLYSASVGDSRLYRIHEAAIQQLTVDHTWIQEALDQGYLTPEQAADHPNQHVIRRYLGSPKTVVPDTRLQVQAQDDEQQARANQGFQLQNGDILVLCTDGLSDLVEDREILQAFQQHSLDDALSNLVKLANLRGGHDNITVVAAQIPDHKLRRKGIKFGRRWLSLPLLIAGATLLCLLVFMLAVYLYQVSSRFLGFGR